MQLKINNNLVLNSVNLEKEIVSNVNLPVNHIMCVDCSGSMYSDLPKIRTQLKNRLPSLVNVNDTVSIIWFSSKGMFGALVNKLTVSTPEALQNLNNAIDRWLIPMSLTGFVEPLNSVKDIITDSNPHSLYFLTDGYDNQWSESEILNVCKELNRSLANSVIIEYGWNCNHDLLAKMATELNGNLIFCENFDKYNPTFENLITTKISAKKVEVVVNNPVHEIVFSYDNHNVSTYRVIDNKVYIPEDVKTIYFYTEETIKSKVQIVNESLENLIPVYMSIAAFAQKKYSSFVKTLLFDLGDVALFDMYSNCFGKQNLVDFCNSCMECVDTSKMRSEGYSAELKENPNAFTLLHLLFALAKDKGNLVALDSMKYNRISIGTEDVADIEDEKNKIIEKLKVARKKEDIAELSVMLKELEEKNPLKFVKGVQNGYPILDLRWNENRANASMLFKIDGKVKLPKNDLDLTEIDTFIWRNYTLIRDGIANINVLPVYLTRETFNLFKRNKVLGGDYSSDKMYNINLRKLPTINQTMVSSVSAKDYFTISYELMKQKASEKVYKAFYEKAFGDDKECATWKDIYSDEQIAYLKENGITDYNGFQCKRVSKEPVDFYYGVELHTLIKGLLKVPSFNEFMKKKLAIDEDVKKGKNGKSFNLGESLLLDAYHECTENCIDISEDENVTTDTMKDVHDWLTGKMRDCKEKITGLYNQLVEMRFSVIVGQSWFDDLEDGSITFKIGDQELVCSAEIKDVKINI